MKLVAKDQFVLVTDVDGAVNGHMPHLLSAHAYQSRQGHARHCADKFNGRAVVDVAVSHGELLRFALVVIHCNISRWDIRMQRNIEMKSG